MNHLSDDALQSIADGLRSPDAHLASCAGCAEALEAYRALARRLEALPPIEVPADFTASVLTRLEALPRARPWIGPSFAGAAALLAVLSLSRGEGLLTLWHATRATFIGARDVLGLVADLSLVHLGLWQLPLAAALSALAFLFLAPLWRLTLNNDRTSGLEA